MKIAVLGTRGIPNKYGGFEQFAEYLSIGFVKRGHHVTVYNPHIHEFNNSRFEGVEIVKMFSPERYIGSAANFLYDYLCLKDALKKDFDIILECGYQSVALSYLICPIDRSIVVTNMDGMEWKRSKWNNFVQKMTKLFEKWGVNKSHALIADNEGIQEYLSQEYGRESHMIPYGAKIFNKPDQTVLKKYGVREQKYYLLIARLEPENNIEMILNGYKSSKKNFPFLVIGDHETDYGKFLKNEFSGNQKIKFLGSIYDSETVNNLRFFSRLYFHGHSVGGTNPSLLEAMGCSALILAHHNKFNRSVLLDGGLYFSQSVDIQAHLNNDDDLIAKKSAYIQKNLERIREVYSWDRITDQYEKLFKNLKHGQG